MSKNITRALLGAVMLAGSLGVTEIAHAQPYWWHHHHYYHRGWRHHHWYYY